MDNNKNINDNTENNVNNIDKNLDSSINTHNIESLINVKEIKLLFWLSGVIFGVLAFALVKMFSILGQISGGNLGGLLGEAQGAYNSLKLIIAVLIIFMVANIVNIIAIFKIRSKALQSNLMEKMKLPNYANPFRLAICQSAIIILAILGKLGIADIFGNLIIILYLAGILGCVVFSFMTLLKNYPIIFNKSGNMASTANNVLNTNDVNNLVNTDNNSIVNIENNVQDNIQGNENVSANNTDNNSQKGFLDNLMEKDNPENKLFLKIIFWLSTAISVMLLYGGIKANSLNSSAKNLANSAGSGSLENLFNSGVKTLGNGMGFLSQAKTMQGIMNLIMVAVIAVSILICLKAKKENNIQKLKNLNYYFIGGLIIFGLLEMYSVNGVIKALTSISGMFGAFAGATPNFGLVKISVIGTFIAALGSAVTNYLFVFKGKNIETGDIKSEINTGIEKINALDPEKKKKYTKIGLIAAGLVVIYYICTSFIFLKNFDMNKYYTVQIDGVSGKAIATVINNPNSPWTKNMEAGKKLSKTDEFAENGQINFIFSQSEGLKNGDVVDVTVEYDKETAKSMKIRPKNTKFKVKVEGLPEYASDANQIKNLKNYITKIAQKEIEKELENNNYNSFNVSNIYYKKNEDGNLEIRYFIQKTLNGYFGGSSFEGIGIGEIVLDKNKNIVSYERLAPKNSYSGDQYNNFAEVEATMASEGFTILN
jgi:hypothetical protein